MIEHKLPTGTAEIDRLSFIAESISAEVPTLFAEAKDDINAMINAALEQHQEDQSEKDLIVNLPIKVKWNTSKNKVEVGIDVAVKHRYSREIDVDNHPKLDFGG